MAMGIMESLGRGFNLFSESLNGGVAFGKDRENFVSVLKYLVVSSLVGFAAWMVAAALAGIAFFFLLPSTGWWVMAPVALICLLLVVGGYTYSYAANFGAMQFIYSGKKVGYFEDRNLRAACEWSLLVVALTAIVLGLLAAALFTGVLKQEGIAGIFIFFGGIVLWLALVLIFVIVTYYALQELAIRREGAIGAIGASWKLVRENFWETIVLAVFLYVISEVVMLIPSLILSFIIQGAAMLFLLGIAGIVVGAGILVLVFLLVLALGFLVEAVMLIVKVGFYKRIAGKGAAAGGGLAGGPGLTPKA